MIICSGLNICMYICMTVKIIVLFICLFDYYCITNKLAIGNTRGFNNASFNIGLHLWKYVFVKKIQCRVYNNTTNKAFDQVIQLVANIIF